MVIVKLEAKLHQLKQIKARFSHCFLNITHKFACYFFIINNRNIVGFYIPQLFKKIFANCFYFKYNYQLKIEHGF